MAVPLRTIIAILAIVVLVIAAWGDVGTRRIPNTVSLALASLGLARLLAAGNVPAAEFTIAAAAGTLVISFALFSLGVFGGGDAKLISAATLVIGARDLFGFLLLMSFFGALLALALLTEDKLIPRLKGGGRPAPDAPAPPPRTVPYGVAIAAAGAAILIFQSSVSG